MANGSISIDGNIDEIAWQRAARTDPFVRASDGDPAAQRTTARLLWDDLNLYVAFEMEDRDLWSTISTHDGRLWTEDAAELFVDADGDGASYVELIVNPRGVTFDSYFPAYRRGESDWESGMMAAVHVDGTVDNRTDVDRGWAVELALPLIAARGKAATMCGVPPRVGTTWRANLYRLGNAASTAESTHAWSPPMGFDVHTLDHFGELVFAD